MEQTIWEQEQQHLKMTSAMLKHYIEFLQQQQLRQKGSIMEERVTASAEFNDMSGERAIEFATKLQTMELQEKEYLHVADQLAKAQVLYKTPYFGRITIKNELGEDETLYIGLSTFRDPDTDDVYIFDWRAPISSLFYENKIGESAYTIPNGEKVQVEITGRRQYKTLYDELLQLLDADIYIGDEVLQNLLKDTAKEKMKSIVSTIQSDQNEVIRSSNRSNLIVLGPPGSGKTSVAMQRIAYLLYEYRQTLNAKNILLISPSDLFNDYISNVLPELGEENVRHSTFYRVWQDAKVGRYHVETNYENIERLQSASEIEKRSYQYKNSHAYYRNLENYVAHISKKQMPFFTIKIGEDILFSAKQLQSLFYNKFMGLEIDFRLKKMRTLILDTLQKNKESDYQKELKRLKGVTKYIGTDEELEMEANKIVSKKYGAMISAVEQLKFINSAKMYIQSLTFGQEDESLKEIADETAKSIKNRTLYYEDLGPMLYLETLIKKHAVHPEIKHIVIDEVQDYSSVQLAAIRSVYPKAHFTLLGDRNQIVHPHKRDVLSAAELNAYKSVELNKSYRSTVEITQFMSVILAKDDTLSLGVSGEKPQIIQTSNQIDEIVRLAGLREQGDSFVVIAKNRKTCELIFEQLKHVLPEARLLTEQDKVYTKGIVIMPGYMAKGFEFTTVVVADLSDEVYREQSDATLLYTIASRATRHLYFLQKANEGLPICMREIPKSLYEKYEK